MMVCPHDHAALAAFGDHRARVGEGQRQRLLAENVLSGRGRGEDLVAMKLVGRRDVDGVDVLRLNQFLQARRRLRDPMLVRDIWRRGPAFVLMTATTSPPLARNALDHVLARRSCWRRSSPHRSFVMERLPSDCSVEVPQEARTIRVVGHNDRFRFKVAAGELAHQAAALRESRDCGRSPRRCVNAGSVCLASSMSSKPMTAKSLPDRDPGFGKRANKPDRDDVVVTKGCGRGLAEVEQLRSRRPAARVVGHRLDDQRTLERKSGVFAGRADSRRDAPRERSST